jgi:hypothetical protein
MCVPTVTGKDAVFHGTCPDTESTGRERSSMYDVLPAANVPETSIAAD